MMRIAFAACVFSFAACGGAAASSFVIIADKPLAKANSVLLLSEPRSITQVAEASAPTAVALADPPEPADRMITAAVPPTPFSGSVDKPMGNAMAMPKLDPLGSFGAKAAQVSAKTVARPQLRQLSASILTLVEPETVVASSQLIAAVQTKPQPAPERPVGRWQIPMVMRGGIVGDAFSTPSAEEMSEPTEQPAEHPKGGKTKGKKDEEQTTAESTPPDQAPAEKTVRE